MHCAPVSLARTAPTAASARPASGLWASSRLEYWNRSPSGRITTYLTTRHQRKTA